MKVLSLFDGMSCGRIALDQLGIPVETYYASEIDKYAIQVSQANYPEIIQVGNICDLDPKDYMDVDLMLAGSPCQGFSFAGKQLAFDDPRSALFFEFIRLLKAIKPKYFLLENVRMKKEFLQVISEQVSECYPEIPFGIEPLFINSSLVSAQSRQRYYWTNIPGIKQPEERGIVLRDILETETDEQPVKDTERNQRHYRDEDEKSLCMTATMYKGAGNNGMTLVPNKPIKVGMNVEQVKIRKHEVDIVGLQQCILSHYAKCGISKKEIAKQLDDKYSTVEHYFRKPGSEYFAIPSDEHWPQLKEILNIKTDKYDKSIMEFEYRDGVFESTQRVYSEEGKSPTLTASNKDQIIETTTSDNGITNIKKGTSGKSWFFEQQTYSKDSKKTRSLKSSSGSGNIPKVIETKKETKPKKAYDIPREILKDNERQRRVYDPSGKSPTILGRSDSPKVTTPKQVGTAVDVNGHDVMKRVYSPDGKSPTVNTCQGGNREPKVVVGGAIRGRAYDKDGKRMDKDGKSVANKTTQMLELRKDKKSNAITTVGKDSVVVKNLPDKSQTIKSQYYKSSRANFERQGTFHATGVQSEDLTWRKLTPLECERLQTVPDDYTNHVSNTQRYKMLGNGWTIEVIKHIFNNMEY
jgi:DNA-cytosine methyltransferase